MHHFFPLLEFAFGALNEACLGSNVVEVAATGEGATQLGNFTTGLVDSDDIAGDDFFLGNRFDHLGTEVVDGLHFGGFERDFTGLGPASDSFVDLDVNDFSFDDLSFFSDSHTCLKQTLS